MQTRRTVTIIAFAALAAVVFILHSIGTTNYLYWVYWWYDIMMHSLTGFVVGGLVGWVIFRQFEMISFSRALAWTFGVTLVIGIGWEFFEYFIDPMYAEQPGIVFDTALDLVLDTLGALIAVLIVTHIGRPQTPEIV